jgi:hypothetical protein
VSLDERCPSFRTDSESTPRREPSPCSTTGRIEVAFDGGAVMVRDGRDPDGPALRFTGGEWAAFVAGVNAGEFDVGRNRAG